MMRVSEIIAVFVVFTLHRGNYYFILLLAILTWRLIRCFGVRCHDHVVTFESR